MEEEYRQKFQRRLNFYKSGRLRRVGKAPLRLIFSFFLQGISRSLNLGIRIMAKTFWNDKMIVVYPEAVSGSIFQYGFFEEGLTLMILKYVKANTIFFDIGAHIGYFTLLGSRLVGRGGQVHSFEPSRQSFKLLQSNIENRENVKVNNFAVWSEETELDFKDFGDRYSANNSFFQARIDENEAHKMKAQIYKVKTISIDQYVDRFGAVPNFIKIDAESSEYQVLKGMDKTMELYRPTIFMEVGDMGVKEARKSKEIVEYIVQRGYTPYEYIEGEIVPHQIKEIYHSDNILFLPRLKA